MAASVAMAVGTGAASASVKSPTSFTLSLWLARSFAGPLAGSRLVRLSVKLRIDGGVDEDRDGDGDDDTLV